LIYERFAAEYILTDLAHDDFINQAELDQSLKEVYQDEEAIIYRVIPDYLEFN
jgi:hypothetical protein